MVELQFFFQKKIKSLWSRTFELHISFQIICEHRQVSTSFFVMDVSPAFFEKTTPFPQITPSPHKLQKSAR